MTAYVELQPDCSAKFIITNAVADEKLPG